MVIFCNNYYLFVVAVLLAPSEAPGSTCHALTVKAKDIDVTPPSPTAVSVASYASGVASILP